MKARLPDKPSHVSILPFSHPIYTYRPKISIVQIILKVRGESTTTLAIDEGVVSAKPDVAEGDDTDCALDEMADRTNSVNNSRLEVILRTNGLKSYGREADNDE